MDAVVGTLQSPGAIYAASKLSHFDKLRSESKMSPIGRRRSPGLLNTRLKWFLAARLSAVRTNPRFFPFIFFILEECRPLFGVFPFLAEQHLGARLPGPLTGSVSV